MLQVESVGREGLRSGWLWPARRLGDDLERDELKLIDAIPNRERPVLVKDGRLQVLGALVAQRLQRPAALFRVSFLDEDERLVLLERRANLSEAVLWRGRGGGKARVR